MKSALKYSGLLEIVKLGDTIFPKDLPADPAPSKMEIRAHEASLKSLKDPNDQASELLYSLYTMMTLLRKLRTRMWR